MSVFDWLVNLAGNVVEHDAAPTPQHRPAHRAPSRAPTRHNAYTAAHPTGAQRGDRIIAADGQRYTFNRYAPDPAHAGQFIPLVNRTAHAGTMVLPGHEAEGTGPIHRAANTPRPNRITEALHPEWAGVAQQEPGAVSLLDKILGMAGQRQLAMPSVPRQEEQSYGGPADQPPGGWMEMLRLMQQGAMPQGVGSPSFYA